VLIGNYFSGFGANARGARCLEARKNRFRSRRQPENTLNNSVVLVSEDSVGAPKGQTTSIVVLSARLRLTRSRPLCRATVSAWTDDKMGTKALMLTGASIDEPTVGRGPFVMNTKTEIRQAFLDLGSGRFGGIGGT